MIDPPKIVHASMEHAAVIHLTIPRAEIQEVMGPGMQEVIAVVTAQGIGPAGPLFSHHFQMSPDVFDFEIGVPVTAPVVATGRVKAGQLPPARVARTVYHGGFEGLGSAWGELHAWIAAEGYKPAPDLWECYVTGPETGPDPATWRTELNRPLA